MAIDFPDSPTNNQTFTSGNNTWQWDGTAWNIVSASTPVNYVISDTAPSSPIEGSTWFDSSSSKMYIYYDSSWLETTSSIAGPTGPTGSSGVVQSTSEPSDTTLVWVDTDDTANSLLLPDGGSTGQVLSKASGTDYDTEWSTLTASDVSDVTASAAAINTIDDGTAGYVGLSNGTSGISYQPLSHNYVINGGFDVFQRGSAGSLALSSAGYALDRWYSSRGGAGGVTISQEQTGSPVGSNYHARVSFTSDGTFSNLFHALEAGEVDTLQGKTVTLSVKLRRNATFSANLNVSLQKNATANTLTGGTWTALDTVSNDNASLPTGTTSADWVTCTLTATIPDDGTANGLRIVISETATSLNGAYYEVAEVQLETGSIATPFKRNSPSLQAELAACQRYYQVYGTQANEFLTTGFCYSTSQTLSAFNFAQELRTTPTISFSSAGDFNLYAVGASGKTVTTIVAGFISSKSFRLQANIGTTDLVAGNATNVFSGSGGGKIEVSAEL